MSTPEGLLTQRCIRYLKYLQQCGRHVWYCKIHGHASQRAGVPDLLIILEGRFSAIELKAPGKKASPLQLHEMGRINAAGAWAQVIDNIEDFRRLFD